MEAAAGSAGDPCPCGNTNITAMQLFHELKQRFPALPDRVVSECIRQNCHDRGACEALLRRENQGYLMHSYPMALKLSVSGDEHQQAGKPCERCQTHQQQQQRFYAASTSSVTSEWYGAASCSAGNKCENVTLADKCQGTTLTSASGAQCVRAGQGMVRSVLQETHSSSSSSMSVQYRPGPLNVSAANAQETHSRSSSSVSMQYHGPDAQCHPGPLDVQCHPDPLDVQCHPGPLDAQCRPGPLDVQCHPGSLDAQCRPKPLDPQCRPKPLDVRAANASPSEWSPLHQPWSAPDVPTSFHPFPPPKSRTCLSVEPAPHYDLCTATPASQQPRSYTSVNLTLRPPSLDPLPPIDIHSAGTSLTYSTSSYDPRQGFQSQLQIRIGPGGVGSVSALRTRGPDARPRSCVGPEVRPRSCVGQDLRPRSCLGPEVRPRSCLLTPAMDLREGTPPTRAESLPDVTSLSLGTQDSCTSETEPVPLHSITHALLAQQLARKERLLRELKREKQKLREMQREVRTMERDLAQRQLRQRAADLALPVVTSVLQKVQSLRQEIQYLQEECKKMTTEVDLSADAHVPLGETDEAFYKNIYTGQRGCVLSRHSTTNTHRQETRGSSSPLDALDLDGPNWTCTECTFRNHPLLDKCEQCEMPRIILAGETQDIHIHVTHHNFPARRVLHSWVV